jgi:DNA gyrase subunit B
MPKQDSSEAVDIPLIQSVRSRPAMYIGGIDYFGLIHYFVCPFALLLNRGATRIDLIVTQEGFEVVSDCSIEIEVSSNGAIRPFEESQQRNIGHDWEGLILNGLSESLEVTVAQPASTVRLTYFRGERTSQLETSAGRTERRTSLRFRPDFSILTDIPVSPVVFQSYLRRMSYLHAGLTFSVTANGETVVYRQPNGIADLFQSVAAPYQILHEPIHIQAMEGELSLEGVFAYQSWLRDDVWCFINRGRAVAGGTHEKGLLDALKRLPAKLGKGRANGVVGVFSIIYPPATWEGCVKAYIVNPELRMLVRRLMMRETLKWVKAHPGVAEELRHLSAFTFPDIWSM